MASAIFPKDGGGQRHGDGSAFNPDVLVPLSITLLASRGQCQEEPWFPASALLLALSPATVGLSAEAVHLPASDLSAHTHLLLTTLDFHSCISCHSP